MPYRIAVGPAPKPYPTELFSHISVTKLDCAAPILKVNRHIGVDKGSPLLSIRQTDIFLSVALTRSDGCFRRLIVCGRVKTLHIKCHENEWISFNRNGGTVCEGVKEMWFIN